MTEGTRTKETGCEVVLAEEVEEGRRAEDGIAGEGARQWARQGGSGEVTGVGARTRRGGTRAR